MSLDRSILRRLAALSGNSGEPIISAYLDLRPEASGNRPALRTGAIVLRDQLHAVARDFPSCAALGERALRWLEDECPRDAAGAAIFAACDAVDREAGDTAGELFMALPTPIPFENRVHAGNEAELLELIGLLDPTEHGLVVVADTNHARFFVRRDGQFNELEGMEAPVDEEHKGHDQGGWAQARYARHIDNNHAAFAHRAARHLDRLLQREQPSFVLVAANQTARPFLLEALSREVRERLLPDEPHIDLHASVEQVAATAEPLLQAAARQRRWELAGQALGEAAAHDLGAVGLPEVSKMLDAGAVRTLIIDRAHGISAEALRAIVREAICTDAEVYLVQDHPAMLAHQGLAAILRFRPE